MRDQLVAGPGGNPFALVELAGVLTGGQAPAARPCRHRCRSPAVWSARSSTATGDSASPHSGSCWSRRPTTPAGFPWRSLTPDQVDLTDAAVDAAERSGLLRIDGDAVDLHHPLVRRPRQQWRGQVVASVPTRRSEERTR